MSHAKGRMLIGKKHTIEGYVKSKPLSTKTIIDNVEAMDFDNPRFAIELFKFTREYAISLDYDRACEMANFGFVRNLPAKEKASILDKLRERLLEYAKPHIDRQLDDLNATLAISPAKILLELEKIATYDIHKSENYVGDKPIVSANEKLKALSMLGRYFGLFEKDNLQRFNGMNISIDNSVNKTQVENLEVENKQIQVNFINEPKENKDGS